MTLENLHKKLMENPKFHRLWNNPEYGSMISNEVIDLRIKKGLTQKQLADLANTHQSAIARLENENSTPTISFLIKIAKATKTRLKINFVDIIDD